MVCTVEQGAVTPSVAEVMNSAPKAAAAAAPKAPPPPPPPAAKAAPPVSEVMSACATFLPIQGGEAAVGLRVKAAMVSAGGGGALRCVINPLRQD